MCLLMHYLLIKPLVTNIQLCSSVSWMHTAAHELSSTACISKFKWPDVCIVLYIVVQANQLKSVFIEKNVQIFMYEVHQVPSGIVGCRSVASTEAITGVLLVVLGFPGQGRLRLTGESPAKGLKCDAGRWAPHTVKKLIVPELFTQRKGSSGNFYQFVKIFDGSIKNI